MAEITYGKILECLTKISYLILGGIVVAEEHDGQIDDGQNDEHDEQSFHHLEINCGSFSESDGTRSQIFRITAFI